jgi:hypothetical protein
MVLKVIAATGQGRAFMTSGQRAAYGRRIVAGLAVCGAAILFPAARAGAESGTAGCPSLKLAPANAAFYGAMLHGREQYDAIVGSRAWAELKALPVIQMGVGMYNLMTADPSSPAGQIEAALQDPEAQALWQLAGEAFSQEAFVYGEPSTTDVVQLLQRVMGSVRYGPAMLEMSGKGHEMPTHDQQAMLVLKTLSENLSLLKTPEFVAGFKIQNVRLAKEELQEIEKRAKEQVEKNPILKGHLKKITLAGHEYLTLNLDGSMIPWDQVPVDEIKKSAHGQADVDKLLAHIKAMKLVIALGMRDDYLLLSVGPNTDVLARLGAGPSLADRPELAPVRKFARKRLTSVHYVSQATAERLENQKQDLQSLVALVPKALGKSQLTPAQQAEIRGDVAALAKDLEQYLPTPAAATSVSFLAADGWETFRYDWSEKPALDASQPLGLLQHLGGDPSLAVLARSKYSLEPYNLLAKWAGVGYRYVEKYGVPKMKPEEREKFQKFTAKALPIIKHLDDVNRNMLLPSLADSQMGLVLDRKLRSKQYAKAWPETEQPMPMVEPAVVLGVNNAALLTKACQQYRDALNAVIDAARQIKDSKIPAEFKIPAPQTSPITGGTLYSWPLPKDWGVTKQIEPNVAITEHVAVISASREHTQRLLAATPLTVNGRTLKADRPLGAVSVLDFASLLDVATPWIDYAAEAAARNQGENGNASSALDQVHVVLHVLKVFRSVTAEVYQQGKATVTHAHVEIRDIE